jgi:hypothetical protein
LRSQITWAAPRRKIEAPIVMMIRVTTEAPRAVSTANLSSAMPTRVAATIASPIATGMGSPAATSETVAMPPIMTNSPWAKLITWLELKMIEKPRPTSA